MHERFLRSYSMTRIEHQHSLYQIDEPVIVIGAMASLVFTSTLWATRARSNDCAQRSSTDAQEVTLERNVRTQSWKSWVDRPHHRQMMK